MGAVRFTFQAAAAAFVVAWLWLAVATDHPSAVLVAWLGGLTGH